MAHYFQIYLINAAQNSVLFKIFGVTLLLTTLINAQRVNEGVEC